mmetsp:Transcript_36357/g.55827  ORF Transcript_36357/g.55827 Transcript_36357/m.55827 type:complete len:229 (+) Transcript_36357:254-940(+)
MESVDHGHDGLHLGAVLLGIVGTGVTPPVPAALRVLELLLGSLREKSNDVVGSGPLEVSGVGNVGLIDVALALLAAMEGHVDLAFVLTVLAAVRHVNVASVIHGDISIGHELGLVKGNDLAVLLVVKVSVLDRILLLVRQDLLEHLASAVVVAVGNERTLQKSTGVLVSVEISRHSVGSNDGVLVLDVGAVVFVVGLELIHHTLSYGVVHGAGEHVDGLVLQVGSVSD